MARTIDEIEKGIIEGLGKEFKLSASATAEWKLWTHCVAVGINIFESILDLFKKEMDERTEGTVPGSLSWYNYMCYQFQMGHSLLFSQKTGKLYYEQADETAKVIKIASVSLVEDTIHFKVATKDEAGEIVPLSDMQFRNFENYVDAIKFAGTKTNVLSTTADLVLYRIQVWYDPVTSMSDVEKGLQLALDVFKTEQQFGGVIYKHKMLEAITSVPGVVTSKITSLQRKGTEDDRYMPIDTRAELWAGYFNYSKDCETDLININDLTN